jgi:hypothetical protein
MKKKKLKKDHQRHRDPKASGAALANKGSGNRREMRDGDITHGKSKEKAANSAEHFGN